MFSFPSCTSHCKGKIIIYGQELFATLRSTELSNGGGGGFQGRQFHETYVSVLMENSHILIRSQKIISYKKAEVKN
jgi:hypothetical protein